VNPIARPPERQKALRLFVAIEIPDDVRALVADAVDPIRERHPEARWLPASNQHVTLKFLGSTPAPAVDRVRRAIVEVATARRPFRTRVADLGGFPNLRRARVLWAGLEDPARAITDLAAALDEALRAELAADRRPFTPHLTLARFDPPVALDALSSVRSEPWTVERLVLFRSRLGPPAPRYEAIEAAPLGG